MTMTEERTIIKKYSMHEFMELFGLSEKKDAYLWVNNGRGKGFILSDNDDNIEIELSWEETV